MTSQSGAERQSRAVEDRANQASDAPSSGRRLFALVDGVGATALETHRGHYAEPPVPSRARPKLIDAIERSGLRGRGGAGFPTGVKMQAVASRRRQPVVVVNGTEGEPISRKDATLLQLQPHLVLDGAALAAAAVGANAVFICIERTQQHSIDAVSIALAERFRAEPNGVAMALKPTPPRYVAGEETALVHWLNGGEAKPTRTPPRPFEKGVGGHPTLIDNVETLAHVTQIVQYGPSWFRSIGTASEPGTALMTLSGAINRPAVYEAPVGARLGALLERAGTPHGIGAVLVGGYFGSWLDARTAGQARMSNEFLRPLGGGLGCGAVAVLPSQCCGVLESARVMRWMADESAGQCGPCVNGLDAIAATMRNVAAGRAGLDALATLERWAGQVDGRGACRFPDGAIRFLRSAMAVFAEDFRDHARGHPCLHVRAPRVLPIPTIEAGWR